MPAKYTFSIATMDCGRFDIRVMDEWLSDNVRTYERRIDDRDCLAGFYEPFGKTRGATIYTIEIDDDQGAVAFKMRWHEDLVELAREINRVRDRLAESWISNPNIGDMIVYPDMSIEDLLRRAAVSKSALDRVNARRLANFVLD